MTTDPCVIHIHFFHVRACHAEEFVRYLRSLKIAPNGHQNATRRRLRDSGIKFILETCCTLFNYAQRHRHLSPYAENPFRVIEIGRMPIEDAKPIVVFDADLERRLLASCDDWQFPVFLTLLLTGLRPGELTHLLLPDDLDLENRWLYVRNKPKLGWQIKTRNERDIPLVPMLAEVLKQVVGNRQNGVVFRQRRCMNGYMPPLSEYGLGALEAELDKCVVEREKRVGEETTRDAKYSVSKAIWRDAGALRTDWIRIEFIRQTAAIGRPEITAPKTLRHSFATCLQDANVDPLIRNELMGHSPTGSGTVLGMTAVYTHTRPETKRKQLDQALSGRPSISLAQDWLESRNARRYV